MEKLRNSFWNEYTWEMTAHIEKGKDLIKSLPFFITGILFGAEEEILKFGHFSIT